MSTRDEYIQIIKSAFITTGKQAAMKFIAAKIPFLGAKIINPIVGWLVGIVVEALVVEAEMQAFFFYIDMRGRAQGKDFEKAAAENYEAQRGIDENRKKVAEANLRRALRELVLITN